VRVARRTRRFALLTLLAIVLVFALALTAFGGNSRPVQMIAVSNLAGRLQTKPFPQILAMHGAVRLQMPISQNQSTAIGYHSTTDGAIALAPLGHQGNEGVLQRVIHKVFGGGGGNPPGTSSTAVQPRHSTSARQRARTSTRRSTGRSSASHRTSSAATATGLASTSSRRARPRSSCR
jgi:hypothetical protein